MRYLALEDFALHLERIKQRADAGGHSASERTLRRIYDLSLANLARAFAEMVVTTETVTLGPGGFYAEVDRPAGGQLPKTVGFMTYDSHAKVYTSFYANGAGMVGTGTGSVNGNTWTWMVEDKFAGRAIKGRTTITMSSPTQYTIKYEMADEKGGYTTIVEGTSTKVAP